MKSLYVMMTLGCLITILAIVGPHRWSGSSQTEVAAISPLEETPIALADVATIVASDGFESPLCSAVTERAIERRGDVFFDAGDVACRANDNDVAPKARVNRNDSRPAKWTRSGSRKHHGLEPARLARVIEKRRPSFYGESRHARERLFQPIVRMNSSRRIHSVTR